MRALSRDSESLGAQTRTCIAMERGRGQQPGDAMIAWPACFFRLDLKNWSRVVLRKRQQDILCVRLSRVHTKTWPSITTLTANHAQPTVSDSQNGSCGGILHKLRERQSQNMPKRK